MQRNDDDPIPLKECALPGTVKVTSRALELAERFQAAIPTGWIVVFNWFDGGRTRVGKDAPWINTGPGLDLGAYRTSDIPEEAVYHEGSFRYAVLIREDVIESHPQKTIDVSELDHIVFK